MKGKTPLRRVCLILVAGSVGFAHAGPQPYRSVKIFLLGKFDRERGGSAEEIRKNADIVVALKNDSTIDLWESLHWGDTYKSDPNIAERAKPLIMILDFYRRVEKPFEGTPVTLYCSDKFAFSDQGRYIPVGPLLKRVKAMIGEAAEVEQAGAGQPATASESKSAGYDKRQPEAKPARR